MRSIGIYLILIAILLSGCATQEKKTMSDGEPKVNSATPLLQTDSKR